MPNVAQLREEKLNRELFKHVLVATDFSATSERALSYALEIARHYGADISIVNAISAEVREAVPMDPIPGELNREQLRAKHEMQKLADETPFHDLRHKSAVVTGEVAKVLSSIIERDHPDLLVLGTRGRGIVKEVALGSVAEKVLRVAKCPVLTVGPCVPPPRPGNGFKSILFATDFGPSSLRAFPLALAIAEDCGANLVLLHMIPPLSFADIGYGGYGASSYSAKDLQTWHEQGRKESLRKLKSLVPIAHKLSLPPQFVVKSDYLPDGILESAEIHSSDLIIMGASRTNSPEMAAHLPWVIVHNTLCLASCPVLTVAAGHRKGEP